MPGNDPSRDVQQSDKHFLTPKNIELFLHGTSKKIVEMQSVDNEVTQGDYFAKDMKKRLTNALSDASLPNDKVELFELSYNFSILLF